ncbi:MAG: GAF domain-containing protein, partial [Acidimicrobiia bacterium]|nr:GAF domain-containing protein [Acidimicrobiia bacterium]
MDKSIYSEMSNLRPKQRGRRGRRKDSPNRPRDDRTASEPAATARPAPPVPQLEPAIPQRAVVTQPPEPKAALPADSHLAASLEHLRRRSTIRSEAPPTPAPAPAPAPIPVPASSPSPTADEPPSSPRPSRRDRKRSRQSAKLEARAEADRAKAEKKVARAAARSQKKGREAAAETPDAPEAPPAQPTLPAETAGSDRPSRRANKQAARRGRRLRIKQARQAVAAQRGAGKLRIAEAKHRSRQSDYLATKIPVGEWKRREARRFRKAARTEAATEVSAIKDAEAAKLEAVQAQLKLERGPGRRRFGRFKTSHLADARVRSIRMGLAGTWVGLATFAWAAWDADKLQTDEYWIPLIAGATGLLAFTLVPWRRFSGRPATSALVFLWLLMVMGGMLSTAPFHESTLGIFIASVWIVLYAGVLLGVIGFALTSALAISAFGLAVAIGPVTITDIEVAWYVAGLAMTTIIVGITVHELRSQSIHTADRLTSLDAQGEALRRRESELLQLYEVSRTIGAGEDMQQVLPELVARTAGYIGAKVGLVILHKPEEGELVALSPLWVAGQALEAEGYRFDVDGHSTAATVFSSGLAYLRNEVNEDDISRDRLLADLGAERVAAVPLQVEGETIGVLLVADKADDFTDTDLAALELLSTPAGLVLNHLARYEVAQETGRRMSEVAQLKSDFVSVVSHELRTPLTSVIGALSTLSRPELVPEDPVARSLLDSASNQAKRLKTLIEDLLTVSKIDNEALPIRLEIEDIGQILTNLIGRVPTWSDHLELSLSPRLPAVAVDPDHFERIITNLVDNARKYASDSRIEVTARAVDEEVWVSVIDHGEGIPFEYEDTIFERFTQIERADTRFKGGTGLGLNIVKDLTEAMRGRVWLEATPGGGATFIIALP